MDVSDAQTARELDGFLAATEKRAYRMAVIATGQHDDALDVVQDAMLKLARKYAHRSATEWPALFHRILQNTLNDWHRRQKVRRTVMHWLGRGGDEDERDDPLEQLPQPGNHHPDDRIGQQQAMQTLDRALADLPLRQQQAFLLRQWEGLDVADTAQAMGISEGSVKTHYSRAVQRLREQLEEHWL